MSAFPAGFASCLVSGLVVLAGCGAGESRPDPIAGTFRMTSAAEGNSRVLALVSSGDGNAFPRFVDATPDAAEGAVIDVGGETSTIADWHFTPYGQGLYRIGSAGVDDRLSLAAGFTSSTAGIELALSKRSAFQLWYVVPLQDGYCRLSSALFPDASLDAGGGVDDLREGATEDAREPRLTPSADDVPGQRWRLVPLADTTAEGLPSLCAGVPR